MHRPSLCSALLSLAVLSFAGVTAHAQATAFSSTASPAIIRSTHYATVPTILGATAGEVQPSAQRDGPCANSSCFETSVIVRANTRWQLQVVQRQPLANASIDWLGADASQTAHRLAVGMYQTVATGQTASFSQSVSLSFAARDSLGAPISAAQLAASLDYRLVALP